MVAIVERARTAATVPAPALSGRLLLQIVTPGEGSSGHYPPATLEAAARSKVFSKGLHTYLDHPGEAESYDRPERSVRDLVGVLTEDARWTGSALVAECEVFASWRDRMVELAPHVGVSIRAFASVEDRPGTTPTVTRIEAAESVDYVTKAGRGGRVLQVLESARRGGAGPAAGEPTVADLEVAIAEAFGRTPPEWATKDRPMTRDEAFGVVVAKAFGRERDPARIAEAERILSSRKA